MNTTSYWYCKNFSGNLKRLMIENNIGARCLAIKLMKSKNTVYNWANGISEPTIGEALIIAKIFNVTLSELIGEEEKNNDG